MDDPTFFRAKSTALRPKLYTLRARERESLRIRNCRSSWSNVVASTFLSSGRQSRKRKFTENPKKKETQEKKKKESISTSHSLRNQTEPRRLHSFDHGSSFNAGGWIA
nr:hypothetical protein Iba_scaffold25926CG0050 [Ipomoea batatas]